MLYALRLVNRCLENALHGVQLILVDGYFDWACLAVANLALWQLVEDLLARWSLLLSWLDSGFLYNRLCYIY